MHCFVGFSKIMYSIRDDILRKLRYLKQKVIAKNIRFYWNFVKDVSLLKTCSTCHNNRLSSWIEKRRQNCRWNYNSNRECTVSSLTAISRCSHMRWFNYFTDIRSYCCSMRFHIRCSTLDSSVREHGKLNCSKTGFYIV